MLQATVPGRVVDGLAAFIRSNHYAPGDRLPSIRQLSEALKVGRNVARDGLLEAQSLGLVRIEPRQGVFVQGNDHDAPQTQIRRLLETSLRSAEPNLIHLIDARLMVETQVAAEAARVRRPEELLSLRQALEAVLAAENHRVQYIEADQKFHLTLARIAGNQVLSTFLEVVWGLIVPAKANVFLSSPSRRQSDREHRELFECVVAGNVEAARAKMDAHIRRGREMLVEYANTTPSAPSSRGVNSSAKNKSKKRR